MASSNDRVRQQQQAVRAADAALARELARRYGSSWRLIRADLDRLEREIQVARARGQVIDEAWLRQRPIIRELQARAEVEMRLFLDFARRRVDAETLARAAKGTADADELLRSTLPPGVQPIQPLPVAETAQIIAATRPGAPLAALFQPLGEEAAHRAVQTLIRGVAEGVGPRETARVLATELGGNLVRALRIARTETLGAYRRAALARYQANAEHLDGWIWVARLDATVCPVCVAMHGTVHDLSEPFATHPNCFPAGTLVAGPAPLMATRRWYEGELVDVQTVSGARLSVTPNHPVLTSQGWVAAGFLHEGDDLVHAASGQAVGSALDPDDEHGPSRIEDVFRALRLASPMAPARVPTSPVDFHGDGLDGEVDVVGADRLLRNSFVATLAKQQLEDVLSRRHTDAALLPRLCPAHQSLDRVAVPSPGRLSGERESLVLLGRAAGDQDAVGGGAVPALYPVLPQHPGDDVAGDPVRLRESILRHAGLVLADEIVQIVWRPFAGHVYNLESQDGWYTANGIVTHNCRCTAAPLTKAWGELGFPGVRETRFRTETGEQWLARQPRDVKLRLLGPGKLALYDHGDLPLADLVVDTLHPLWGPGKRQRALRDLPLAV